MNTPGNRTRQLSIRITHEDGYRFDMACKRLGIEPSVMARLIIVHALDLAARNEATLFDVLGALGANEIELRTPRVRAVPRRVGEAFGALRKGDPEPPPVADLSEPPPDLDEAARIALDAQERERRTYGRGR